MRPSGRIASVVICLASAIAGAHAANFTVTGVVRNEAGQGVANADLDFIEFCTQQSIFLVNDKTLADGSYSITIAEGTYDVHYTPPTGSTLAAGEREDLAVHSNLNLGVTTLHPGIKVAGTVKNSSGSAVANVDLDFVNVSTDRKVFVPNDLTDSTGKYSVRVLPGTYDVEYRPPATTTLLTGLRKGLVATADVTGLLDTLGNGNRLDGKTTDDRRVAVKDVDIDVVDLCTGDTIPTAHDNTDANGNFTLWVASGTYDIRFIPPRCTTFGSNRIASRKVNGNTGLGEINIPDGFAVTGRVLDSSFQPLPAADLNVYDAATGTRQETSRDDTDGSGNFKIYVPVGTWSINVNPPVGRSLLVGRVESVTVAGATALGDIVLSAGNPLSGLVTNSGGIGVNNVDVDVRDAATGASVRITHDNSNAGGTFTVVVPSGTWDVQYAPPACSPLAPGEQKGRAVSGPTSLSTMALVTGVHATGFVKSGPTAPVANVDLDLFPPGTRNKIYTVRDNTGTDGSYDVLVPPGTYDIDYSPPAGLGLRPEQRFGVALAVSTNLADVLLHSGPTVSGFVKANATGAPAASVDLDFVPSAGGAVLFTPHDTTAVDGSYGVVVENGTWDILYSPPAGSGLAPKWTRGVAVSANLSLADTFLLPLTVPTIATISPGSGTTAGGQTVTLTGTGFQQDATVKVGGVSATNVTVVSATTITAKTPAHPPGLSDVAVTNPGNQLGTKAAGYTFTEPAVPVQITLVRSGNNVVLNWTGTGQPNYTIFRNGTPTGWSDGSVAAKTTATSWTDAGAAAQPGITFYNVN